MVDTAPNDPSTGESEERRRRSYLQGLSLLLIVVFLWTASNFLTNALLTTGGYDKPFFVTYANTSSFALYLIPYLFSGRLRRRWRAQERGGLYSPLRQSEEGDREVGQKELPKWMKTLGFDVPTVASEGVGGVVGEPAIAPFAVLAAEERARGRANRLQPQQDSSPSTPLLQSRPASPARPFLISTAVPRPSSIDGRRPRTSISLIRPTSPTPLPLPPLTLHQTALLASQFTLIWFGANWAINAGLGLTSVASGTTIGSASGFFTLALGALLGVDRFTWARLGAVCVSAMGVAAVTFADRDTATSTIGAAATAAEIVKRSSDSGVGIRLLASKPPNAPLGDMLALLSAFLYSLYVMLLKTRIGSEDRISMPLMFGLVGAINILFLWPFLPLLHYTGIEPFSLPPTPQIWAGIVINMSITFVSDFIYLLAMLKSSPLITTLGLSLTIPLAVIIDAVKGSHTGGVVAGLGSVMVLCSFGFVGWDDHRVFKEEKRRMKEVQAQAQVASAREGVGSGRERASSATSAVSMRSSTSGDQER